MELGKYIVFYVIQSEFRTGCIFASENKAIVTSICCQHFQDTQEVLPKYLTHETLPCLSSPFLLHSVHI